MDKRKYQIRNNLKGWGQSAKLGTHNAICSKLDTALQAYALNPCTKFPPNPTSNVNRVVSGKIYTAGKIFTLPPGVTGVTNSNSVTHSIMISIRSEIKLESDVSRTRA